MYTYFNLQIICLNNLLVYPQLNFENMHKLSLLDISKVEPKIY
jgi:hypothetical protein